MRIRKSLDIKIGKKQVALGLIVAWGILAVVATTIKKA